MKIQILRSSMEELAVGLKFYDRQETGIGDYFFDCLFSEIDSLTIYGGIHSMHFGFHRLFAKRFPYAIYYRIIDDRAVVFRILDFRHNRKQLCTFLTNAHQFDKNNVPEDLPSEPAAERVIKHAPNVSIYPKCFGLLRPRSKRSDRGFQASPAKSYCRVNQAAIKSAEEERLVGVSDISIV